MKPLIPGLMIAFLSPADILPVDPIEIPASQAVPAVFDRTIVSERP